MSNISRLAPYAYLAKRAGGGTLYDLLLLVPVDTAGDTDLTNVSPVKPGGSTRVTVDYTTNGNNAGTLYRAKSWAIDSSGGYLDIEIQGDTLADRTTILKFADADTQPASILNDQQTCAPYLFAKIETVGADNYIQPSCIILFDGGLGAQTEAIIFAAAKCSASFTLGNSSPKTDPKLFVINQDIKAKLTVGQEYTFEGTIAANPTFSKPPRTTKVKGTTF